MHQGPFDPLSRCTLCNTRLERVDPRLLASLPPRIRALGAAVHVCPRCGHLYQEGSHVRRIRRRLESFTDKEDDGDAN